jgi:PDZ domain
MLVVVLIACLCPAQQLSQRLTNQDVIDMTSLGLSDDVVIDKIHATEDTEFDTGISGLKALKAAKVSDAVIRAMINPHPATTPAKSTGLASSKAADQRAPDEVGVYLIVQGQLAEMEPEIVGWQTGGVLKRDVTLGLTKGHVNGKIMNPKSPIQVSCPVVFAIRTPEGTSVTEYQLLRLDQKSNRREFRAMTGGIIHASGGAERNSIPFEPKKIASRTWKISLNSLRQGEYGLLPPGVSSASISSNGKMYTFGIVEGNHSTARWNLSQGESSAEVQTPVLQSPTAEVVGEGAIGASADGNPNVSHDGVTLSRVIAGGPADQVGIKAGDAILAIDNHYVVTIAELNREIRRQKPGTKIAVRYRRYSTIYDTYVVVGRAP